MRKILFTLLAVGAMLAAIPAASLAHGGDHHQGDRHRDREHQRELGHARHDVRIQHERFGGRDGISHDVGTVSAFANGRLTIHLNDGSNVTGAVDRLSEIECELPEFMRPADQGPGGSGSGSSGGPGGPGGDNGQGGPGHNVGDDNGQGGPGDNAGDDNGQGGPDNDPGDDNGDRRCTTIVSGMAVRDATLTLTSFGAVWTRVDLIDSSQ
jgi:hypothetical protein